jgi:hypothetical protein
MEGKTSLLKTKEIFGQLFIGPDELSKISVSLGIKIPNDISSEYLTIPCKEDYLLQFKDQYILILGIPFFKDGSSLTLVKLRSHFGCDPAINEPCFYNQDWYLNEIFANTETFKQKWYLITKNVFDEYRGKTINELASKELLVYPSALLCAYAFFAFYLYSQGAIALWKSDFVWCCDNDSNNDPIYVGRYFDPKGTNKNGFNVHRHLSIKNHHSVISISEF